MTSGSDSERARTAAAGPAGAVPAGHHLTRPINAVDLKDVLRKIDTDRGNFVHGRLLIPRGL